MNRQDAQAIFSLLLKQYPDARESPTTVCRGTPFEVLILTILSAQTTDRAVLKSKGSTLFKVPDAGKTVKGKG